MRQDRQVQLEPRVFKKGFVLEHIFKHQLLTHSAMYMQLSASEKLMVET